MANLQDHWEVVKDKFYSIIDYSPNLLGAIIVLVVGWYVVKYASKGVQKVLEKSKTDPMLIPFLMGIISSVFKIILFLAVVSALGIEVTTFMAILGAAGLAIGMALSGTLQNFAGGVLILVFKPFKVGDTIRAKDNVGEVAEIQLFTTILRTQDNTTIMVPNGGLSTATMQNYSSEKTRMVEWTFRLAPGKNLEETRKTIINICEQDSRVLREPSVFVGINEFNDLEVEFIVRAWVMQEIYWPVFYDINEQVYLAFEEAIIEQVA